MHPERVRTITLDGVLPPDVPAFLTTIAQSEQRALGLIFERCAADDACRRAFPELRGEFEALIGRLERAPAQLEIRDPQTGRSTALAFTREMFVYTILWMTYSAEESAKLPFLIHAAYRKGLDAFAELYLRYQYRNERLLRYDTFFSILCAEDYHPGAGHDMIDLSGDTYLGSWLARNFDTVCSTWSRGAIPPDFNTPVASDVPALLLSGEADPVTPPSNAEHAAKTLPNSRHFIAPDAGHGVMKLACIADIVTDFVELGQIERLRADCIQKMTATPFRVT
jgi:pimeloyl-ACP methyl ester carboxylesterase